MRPVEGAESQLGGAPLAAVGAPDAPIWEASPPDRLAFLAEASAVLNASLDYETTLASVSRLVVPALADYCGIYVVDDQGQLRRLALAHANPDQEAMAADIQGRYPLPAGKPEPLFSALRTGQSVLYPDVTDDVLVATAYDAEHLEQLRRAGLRSAMIVPLVARDRQLGALMLVTVRSGRRYGPADLLLAEDLARRAALAVDNARLYQETQQELAERRQAELRLQESEARFRAQYQGIPIPTYTWRREGDDFVLVDFNAAAAEITRGEIPKLLGHRTHALYPGQTEVLEAFERCFRERLPVHRELLWQLASTGDVRQFNVSFAFVPPDLVMVHTQDIADRKRAEAVLRENEALYRELFDEAPVGYHEIDTEGRITRVNRTDLQMLGYTAAELLGRPLWEIIAESELSKRTIRALLAGREPSRTFERSFIHKDGSHVPTLVESRLLRDAAGRITGMRSTIQDITERVEIQRRRDALLRVARGLAAETDAMKILSSLPAASVDVTGGDAAVIYRWDDDQALLLSIRNSFTRPGEVKLVSMGEGLTGQAIRQRQTLLNNDYLETSNTLPEAVAAGVRAAVVSPLLHEGQLLGAIAVVTYRADKQFTQADAIGLELLAGLAAAALFGLEQSRLEGVLLAARTAQHELNNKLALTQGYAELLAHDPELPPRLRRAALAAMQGTGAAAEILNRLRAVTRVKEKTWGDSVQPTLDLAGSTGPSLPPEP